MKNKKLQQIPKKSWNSGKKYISLYIFDCRNETIWPISMIFWRKIYKNMKNTIFSSKKNFHAKKLHFHQILHQKSKILLWTTKWWIYISHSTMLCTIDNTSHMSKILMYYESYSPGAFIDVYIVGIAPYGFYWLFMIFDVIFDKFSFFLCVS